MGMKIMPSVTETDKGKYWENSFESFKAKVYVPKSDPIFDIINYGFKAPFLIVFEENENSMEEAISFAETSGLAEVAKEYGSSVVFVYPTCEGGWDKASNGIFADVICESKIHQYYKDGMVTFRDRFTGEFGDCFIRGAVFRTYIFGFGKSADYIASHCLKTIEGEYLWGPGDITPAGAVLNNLSVVPTIERDDISVVSVGNDDSINKIFKEKCNNLLVSDKEDYDTIFKSFLRNYKRWCSKLESEPDFESLGMVEELSFEEVKTSPDNLGDDKNTDRHKVGYIAYYNKNLFDNGPVPLLLAYHGGGDSSLYISHVSGWWEVAHDHNFLLVAIENHLNSTATEMIELIEKLKKKYSIDEHRIYASGFSMGGCKSWDCFQEYPNTFAALAPMDATFEVGLNSYGKSAPCNINRDTAVPLFYAGGEITPLPELPFQAEKCFERTKYVFEVNKLKRKYDVSFEQRDIWQNRIWGIDGDRTEKIYDASRDSYLTIQYFESEDGITRTAFASISGQGHECRKHTCEHAWKFMSQFTR